MQNVRSGFEECRSFVAEHHRPLRLLMIGQDTIDGRYGSFHLERILELADVAGDLSEIWVCNVAIDPSAKFDQTVGPFLKRSWVSVRDEPSQRALLNKGFSAHVYTDLAKQSSKRIAQIVQGQQDHSKTAPTGTVSIGVCLSREILKLDSGSVVQQLTEVLANLRRTNQE